VPSIRNTYQTEIDWPPAESLKHLGSLIYSSYNKDCVLIKIESALAQERIVSLCATEAWRLVDWNNITTHIKTGARITAHLTGGDLDGNISDTSSYTCLPYSTEFQEIYVVKFDGSLSYGDCGSAVVDAITGKYHGYIVAGCRETGSAYVMAAHHVSPELVSAHRDLLRDHLPRWPSVPSPPQSLQDDASTTKQSLSNISSQTAQDTAPEIPPEFVTKSPNRKPSFRFSGGLMRSRSVNPRFSKSMKRWRQEFFTLRALKELSFVEKRREIGCDTDELDTFLCDNGSSSSPSYRVITGFCSQHDPKMARTSTPTKARPALAWIDIRSQSNDLHLNHTGWHDAIHLEEFVNKVSHPV
jgi:hypothetical protein